MNINSWLMFAQYAACFGVELTVNNVAAGYFSDEFGLSTSKAGVVASLFGLMNLFARSLGGIWSGEFDMTQGVRVSPKRLWRPNVLMVSSSTATSGLSRLHLFRVSFRRRHLLSVLLD